MCCEGEGREEEGRGGHDGRMGMAEGKEEIKERMNVTLYADVVDRVLYFSCPKCSAQKCLMN